MPWLGFGVFQMTDPHEAETAVRWALEAGYRSIDTAAIYRNEEQVGRGIKTSGVAREDIFLTTKVWNDDLRRDNVRAAFEQSLKRLDTDYVDLYLIHWPVKDCYKDAWDVLQELYAEGRVKATVPLPIAGLMSDAPMETVRRQLDEIIQVAHDLGAPLADPFMALGFIALPVIPKLKITDNGLVDVERFEVVPLFCDP